MSEIIPGSRYAPIGRNRGPDMTGAEFANYRVTKRVPSANHTAAFEYVCRDCGTARRALGSSIRRAISGERPIVACRCKEAEIFDAAKCRDELEITPSQLHTLLRIMAFEIHEDPAGIRRVDLLRMTGKDVESSELSKAGYIVATGMPARLTATPKAWRRTGFKKPEKVA